jgi:hypothetical protein
MKTTFPPFPTILAFLFLVPLCSLSQSFDRIFSPDFYAEVTKYDIDNNGFFNISSTTGDNTGYGNQLLWLTRLDSLGNVLFYHELVGGERITKAEWIPSPDGKMIVLFHSALCDAGGSWQIKGLDEFGFEEWIIDEPFESSTAQIYPYNNNLFCIQTPETLYAYHYFGGLVSQSANNLPNLEHHTFLEVESILAYSPSIAVYKNNILTYENQALTGVINARKLEDSDGYAVVTSSELMELDSSLVITSSVNLSNMGEIIDFDTSPAGFWVLFKDFVVQLDTNLNIIDQKNIPYEGVRIPQFISFRNGFLTIVGDERPVNCIDKPQTYFIQSFKPDTVYNFTNNVKVLDIWTPNPPVAEIGPIGYLVIIPQINIVIENLGADTLNSVQLDGMKALDIAFCEMSIEYDGKHENLHIPPGGSKNIQLGGINIPFQLNISPFNICYWAFLPNDKSDADISDNCLCKDFEVIVSNKDVTNKLLLNISPNPNSGQFNISGIPENLSRLKIYNAAGICVYDALPLVSEGTADIMLSHNLAPGVYFLVTNDEHSGSLSRKFILQNL